MLSAAKKANLKFSVSQITRLLPEIAACSETTQRALSAASLLPPGSGHEQHGRSTSPNTNYFCFSAIGHSRGFSASGATNAEEDWNELSNQTIGDSAGESTAESTGEGASQFFVYSLPARRLSQEQPRSLLQLLAFHCEAVHSAGSLLNADAISYAVSAAEEVSLAEAWDDAWILNRAFQYGLQWIHTSTGLPW